VGQFGQQGRIDQLQGVSHCGLMACHIRIELKGAMANSLAMCPNGIDLRGLEARSLQQSSHDLGVMAGDLVASQGTAV